MTARKEVLPASDLHAAQRYPESLLDPGEALSPGDIEEIRDSIEGIRPLRDIKPTLT